MKLFFKLLMFLLVLACALPFIMKGPDGRPLMRIDDLKWPKLGMPKLPDGISADAIKEKLSFSSDDGQDKQEQTRVTTSTLYKWRDAEGVPQYTGEKPPEGIPYKTLAVRSDTNVVSSVKEPPPEEPEPATDKNARSENPDEKGSLVDDLTSIYSPENIKGLINQAKEVKKISEERKKMLDGLTGKH